METMRERKAYVCVCVCERERERERERRREVRVRDIVREREGACESEEEDRGIFFLKTRLPSFRPFTLTSHGFLICWPLFLLFFLLLKTPDSDNPTKIQKI